MNEPAPRECRVATRWEPVCLAHEGAAIALRGTSRHKVAKTCRGVLPLLVPRWRSPGIELALATTADWTTDRPQVLSGRVLNGPTAQHGLFALLRVTAACA